MRDDGGAIVRIYPRGELARLRKGCKLCGMKLALKPYDKQWIILYQESDEPVLGRDVGLTGESPMKCLRALADFLQIQHDKKANFLPTKK